MSLKWQHLIYKLNIFFPPEGYPPSKQPSPWTHTHTRSHTHAHTPHLIWTLYVQYVALPNVVAQCICIYLKKNIDLKKVY